MEEAIGMAYPLQFLPCHICREKHNFIYLVLNMKMKDYLFGELDRKNPAKARAQKLANPALMLSSVKVVIR